MWECPKCSETSEDTFDVCWNCGTSQSGQQDATFQADMDAESDTHAMTASQNQSLVQEENARHSDSRFRHVCLTIGQIVSVLGCFAAVLSSLVFLTHLRDGSLLVLLASICSFFYSAALFYVFTYVKQSR
jgi:predicted ATP-dependent serine protease